MRGSGGLAVLVVLSILATAGCRRAPVDLTKGLQVDVTSTGWFDAGIVDRKNKLVPTISFTLRNVSDQVLAPLQVNAMFRRIGETDEWGSGFLTVAGSGGVKAGDVTGTLTIKSHLGYTGTESRAEMLSNPLFVDAKVELFAKYGSTQWVKVGEYPIARRLIQ